MANLPTGQGRGGMFGPSVYRVSEHELQENAETGDRLEEVKTYRRSWWSRLFRPKGKTER